MRAAASSDSPRRRDSALARALNGTRASARPARRGGSRPPSACAGRRRGRRAAGAGVRAAARALPAGRWDAEPRLKRRTAPRGARRAAAVPAAGAATWLPSSLILGRTGRSAGFMPPFLRTRRSLRSLPRAPTRSWSRGIVSSRRGGDDASLRREAISAGSRCARAQGLLDHLVHQPELQEPVGREVERLGRHFLLILALPQDGRAALRRDDRVGAVLKHQQPVAHPDGKRPARAALPGHHGDEKWMRADSAIPERAVERGAEQRARHLDRHAAADAVLPPLQPVFTSQQSAPCRWISASSILP